MRRLVPILCALAALAAAAGLPGAGAGAEAIDQQRLGRLHRAGQAFAEALSHPETPLATLKDLRQKLEIEAEKVEGRAGNRAEKYVYDLYSTAAAEYAASLARYESHGSLDRFRKEIEPVEDYLKTADRLYRGEEAGPARRPEPEPPSPKPEATPVPAAPPAPPAPPAPATAPEPAPASAAPPVSPSPAPAEPSATPAAAIPPAHGSETAPPVVEMTPNEFRRRADRVRITKAPEAVRGCASVAEVSIPGKSRQGVYEVGGRNFFYENSLGLARLKTVEAGGDTFLVRSPSKADLAGEAYRCGN